MLSRSRTNFVFVLSLYGQVTLSIWLQPELTFSRILRFASAVLSRLSKSSGLLRDLSEHPSLCRRLSNRSQSTSLLGLAIVSLHATTFIGLRSVCIGSVQGPYRQAMKETQTASFPFCNLIRSPEGEGKSYSRSLLSAGYGFPLRDLTGDRNTTNRPAVHMKTGLCIGDVIAIDSGASFKYFFNVFKASSDPAQSRYLPPSFEPFGTSLEDMQIKTSILAPGTVISSPGVDVTRISTSPL